ncbi:MAG: tripartite tricarboxylate transporter TctB family protein [Betaproteobacteria bacterium]|jgi:putative tricarboxylic transport membrane protein|nr:tripartite tricarboxylate transporter TctB family protein [Betaproteobacteria bacterium]MBK7592914.1 tripartite tricarboxylate transporter TctB family protein [Betaproteobacteria bacterium]MBK7743417.1 tripartite tricarboxylate transporter TctB family protein [Betaproteobacteria bacterium]MBK8688539.1 tripartite tricarboxylate transporter TctB family protein [Betaproteobacteria bacterium]MBK9675779.1 tripartite tricarboxylate transporter TctB family protein [Betaproteobacteria bacterium]
MNAGSYPASPRADFLGALAWIAFGALIVVMSWQMDRFAAQGATPHTYPGLWPGLVGGMLAALGGILALRSLGRARSAGWQAGESDDTEIVAPSRFALGAGLFFVYALLLVGRGLPFWLGTALFVTAFVFLFQRAQRTADGRAARGIVVALVCGGATAAAVTVVFEQLFLVRLP